MSNPELHATQREDAENLARSLVTSLVMETVLSSPNSPEAKLGEDVVWYYSDRMSDLVFNFAGEGESEGNQLILQRLPTLENITSYGSRLSAVVDEVGMDAFKLLVDREGTDKPLTAAKYRRAADNWYVKTIHDYVVYAQHAENDTDLTQREIKGRTLFDRRRQRVIKAAQQGFEEHRMAFLSNGDEDLEQAFQGKEAQLDWLIHPGNDHIEFNVDLDWLVRYVLYNHRLGRKN